MTTRPTCSIPDCDNPVQARGWCQTHYMRWYEHGDPDYISARNVGNMTGRVRIPLTYADPAKQAEAWAGQVRLEAATAKLCDHPAHIR